MERRTIGWLGALTAVALLAQAAPAAAGSPPHPLGWEHADRDDRGDHYDRDDRHDRDDRFGRGDRYEWGHHPYAYRERVVRCLPRGYRTVHYRGGRYYYGGGRWYRPYGARFMIVQPPTWSAPRYSPH